MDKSSYSVNKLVDGGSNSNYFIDLRDILDRNAALDIVKEIRLEQSKANRSTKIIDKKIVIWGMRSAFKDMMKIRYALKEIQVMNNR